jgi:hypothetical protein
MVSTWKQQNFGLFLVRSVPRLGMVLFSFFLFNLNLESGDVRINSISSNLLDTVP